MFKTVLRFNAALRQLDCKRLAEGRAVLSDVQAARAAGIRRCAGGATEAEETGLDLGAIRTALTHSDRQEATTMRYLPGGREKDQARGRCAERQARGRSRRER
jgi:hypothetical protein